MIGPEDVRRQAERRYRDFLSAAASGEDLFPIEVRFSKVKPGELSGRYADLRAELAALREGSDEGGRPSYRVTWEERADRLAGRQKYPVRIFFPDEASLLGYLCKREEAERFRSDCAAIRAAFPGLREWTARRPERVVACAGEWERILTVLRWFADHPRPGIFTREIPVVEDTKFVERNRAVLRELLDLVLPESATDAAARTFEERFGLLRPGPTVRIRFLDGRIAEERLSGVSDLAVPAAGLDRLAFPELRTLIVVENKTSFSNLDVFLTLPCLSGAAAVFGSGFAAQALSACAWMADRNLLYWGDIDTHGFRILAAFRASYPSARSVLMDEATFDRFPDSRSDAPPDRGGLPPGLREDEAALFSRLASLSARNRLEQERIPAWWAAERIGEGL